MQALEVKVKSQPEPVFSQGLLKCTFELIVVFKSNR